MLYCFYQNYEVIMKTVENINIEKTIQETEKLLSEEKDLSPALKSVITVLLLIIRLLANQRGLNSKNSSKPPSTDKNKEKKLRKKSDKEPGGQRGHIGKTLKKFDNPDKIKNIDINRTTLPVGKYTDGGYESRQVVDIKISRHITEYRAQILFDESGKKYVAEFPEKLTQPIQYGSDLKAHAVYMSQFQLIPYNRVCDYFSDQMGIPLSAGSVCNFNKEAFSLLSGFDDIVKEKLIKSDLIQHNYSISDNKGTVRGLNYLLEPMAKE